MTVAEFLRSFKGVPPEAEIKFQRNHTGSIVIEIKLPDGTYDRIWL